MTNIDTTGKAQLIGKTFKVHPASDWFMRGATEATVTSVKAAYCYVRLSNMRGEITPKKSRPISYQYLMTR